MSCHMPVFPMNLLTNEVSITSHASFILAFKPSVSYVCMIHVLYCFGLDCSSCSLHTNHNLLATTSFYCESQRTENGTCNAMLETEKKPIFSLYGGYMHEIH